MIKAKLLKMCSNVFWHMGLRTLSVRAYVASHKIRNVHRNKNVGLVHDHECKSNCVGYETCTEAPARALHDYESLRAL